MNLEFTPGRPAAQADAALRHALETEEKARKCAVLWFADILDRKLFRNLGRSSMQQYARLDLGFSESRISDFMHLARKLDKLPALKAALPEIGYTKAREIVKVASPRTEGAWVDRARTQGRRDLATQVKRALKKARKPAASLFDVPKAKSAVSTSAPPAAEEVPVRVTLEFTPEQFERWESLLAGLAKRGVTGDRAELILDALVGKLEETTSTPAASSNETARRRAVPPVQVHVHRCPDCERTETAGGRLLGPADVERLRCDAAVSRPDRPNTTTIPPRTRRLVLARDHHRCTAPGCHRTRFLEVHHIVPRTRGGTNQPENLRTLCSSCHRLWHEKGGIAGGEEMTAKERNKLTKSTADAPGDGRPRTERTG